MGKILVTGANGFIGKALVEKLAEHGEDVVAVLRTKTEFSRDVTQIKIENLSEVHDWPHHFQNVDVIVHTAARVHVMKDSESDPLTAFRKVNRDATKSLAEHAAKAGVKRFIFISTIKVNGEHSIQGQPFTERVDSVPSDAYALSKYEAEQELLKIAVRTCMEVVIIRPPLVYGEGVKGNFASMIKLIKKGIPLPFGAVNNRRSLIALDNLLSFITLCMSHPKAGNQVFLIADDEDVSTAELVNRLAESFRKKVILIPIPVFWIRLAGKLFGVEESIDKLLGTLQISTQKARQQLGWKPVTTMVSQFEKIGMF